MQALGDRDLGMQNGSITTITVSSALLLPTPQSTHEDRGLGRDLVVSCSGPTFQVSPAWGQQGQRTFSGSRSWPLKGGTPRLTKCAHDGGRAWSPGGTEDAEARGEGT